VDDGKLSLPAPGALVPPVGPARTADEGDPFGTPPRSTRTRAHDLRRRIGGALAAAAALVAKFFAAIKGVLLLLPKLKVLTTAGTAFVSIAAYALFWGWSFAAGLVLLLFVHEMGHVIQLRREGVKASAPMFIPFLGAVVAARTLGENALAEARVGLAGPVLGTAGAAVCWLVAEATGSDLLRALAYFGFFINLFNLLPVVPLDGGRAMAAMAPWVWFVGLAVLIALAFVSPNPILLIIIALGAFEAWRRWKLLRTPSPEQAAYYRVAPRNRVLVGLVYVGLIAALAFGMYETHILHAAGQSFNRL
jgi:Zn-dependent protease